MRTNLIERGFWVVVAGIAFFSGREIGGKQDELQQQARKEPPPLHAAYSDSQPQASDTNNIQSNGPALPVPSHEHKTMKKLGSWKDDLVAFLPAEATLPTSACEQLNFFNMFGGSATLAVNAGLKLGLTQEQIEAVNRIFAETLETVKNQEARNSKIENLADGSEVIKISADSEFAQKTVRTLFESLSAHTGEDVATALTFSAINNQYFGRFLLSDQQLSFYEKPDESGQKNWYFEQVFSRISSDGTTESSSISSTGREKGFKERYGMLIPKTGP